MTESMTMLTTMIWGIPIRVQILPVQLSEGLASTLTLGGAELAVHQLSQVSHLHELIKLIYIDLVLWFLIF